MTFFDRFKKEKPLQAVKTSPAKLKLYMQCPYKYECIHIKELTSDQPVSPHLTFHSILKDAIDSYQKRLAMGGDDTTRNLLEELIRDGWSKSDFAKADQIGELELFFESALESARAMTRWFAARKGWVSSYKNQPAIGIFAPLQIHPVTVWTRLDRVERRPDRGMQLVQFKSGTRQLTRDEFALDPALRLQAAAAIEIFGRDITHAGIVYLRTADTYDIPVSSMRLNELQDDVIDLMTRIQKSDFPPHTGPLCSVCEYIENCPGWPRKPWTQSKETRDRYQSRLRLSYSKMSLFERCPRAFRRLYVDRIPPRPQPFFSFGSCIHSVMETFYDKENKTRRTPDYLHRLLDEKWSDFRLGYSGPEEERRYRDNALSMLDAYYSRFVENKSFKPAAQIESYFEIPVGPKSVVTGFIDRIDKRSKGGYIIYDYKTEPTARTQESADADLQLTLYYWAAREFLKLDIGELGLFMMSHDTLITTTRQPLDIPALLDRVEQVTAAILAENRFEPKINKYCLNCDHLAGCPLEAEIRGRRDLRSMEFQELEAE